MHSDGFRCECRKGHLMALLMSYLIEDLFCMVGAIMERTRSSFCVAVRNNVEECLLFVCFLDEVRLIHSQPVPAYQRQ